MSAANDDMADSRNSNQLSSQMSPEDNEANIDDEAEVVKDVEGGIKKLADSRPRTLMEMFSVMTGSTANPIYEKLNERHIEKSLDLAEKHDERDYNLRNSQRRYVFLTFLVVVGLVVFMMVLFRHDHDLLLPLLTGLSGLAAGFIGGYGIGRRSDD